MQEKERRSRSSKREAIEDRDQDGETTIEVTGKNFLFVVLIYFFLKIKPISFCFIYNLFCCFCFLYVSLV